MGLNSKYIPDKETKWDYIIQRINELDTELMILKEIAKDLGIPECDENVENIM